MKMAGQSGLSKARLEKERERGGGWKTASLDMRFKLGPLN